MDEFSDDSSSEAAEAGRCFCGEITATISGAPFWVCYDHDQDCRRATGAPVMIWVGFRPEQFRITRGRPKSFSKTRGVVRSFCSSCGTSISYVDEGLPDELYLTLGFLTHPERFLPQAHAYWSERLPWMNFADELPRIERYSRERDARLGLPRDR